MESAFSRAVRRYWNCLEYNTDAVSKNYCVAESRGLFVPKMPWDSQSGHGSVSRLPCMTQ